MKPDSDHGGNGFRILDEGEALLASLGRPPSVRVSQEVADQLLASVERFDPLVVSEYLPGPELSIDCLSSPAGELLAALPRSKGGLEWTRELVDDPAALDIAAALVRAFGLRYLSNVQVKYSRLSNGRPVLLEVNTRAASGLYQSCRAGGVNLPALALRLTLGEDITIPEPGLRTLDDRLQRSGRLHPALIRTPVISACADRSAQALRAGQAGAEAGTPDAGKLGKAQIPARAEARTDAAGAAEPAR